jgi:hypothetical protein|tara:strand:+ start:61338 stop:61865 length:528 start_codon:yes stop_codon:yes gene_type:complete
MLTSTTVGFVGSAFDYATSFSVDFFIILALFALLVGYSFRYGKARIISLILSLYLALLIFIHFPYGEIIQNTVKGQLSLFAVNSVIFFIILIVSYIVLNRLIRVEFSSRDTRRWSDTILLSAFATVLLLAFSYHVLPIVSIHDFEPRVDLLFERAEYFFWWLLIPLAGLLFTVRR